jgi:beta-lactamase superfamily II metal-dependent hydrolase
VAAIDVGQGDATLIVGPDVNGERFAMLIDAGRGTSTRAIEPLFAHAGVTELDVFLATHYDEDHVGGAVTATGKSVLWTTDEVNGELECEARSFFPTDAIVDPGPSPGITDAEKEWDRDS